MVRVTTSDEQAYQIVIDGNVKSSRGAQTCYYKNTDLPFAQSVILWVLYQYPFGSSYEIKYTLTYIQRQTF